MRHEHVCGEEHGEGCYEMPASDFDWWFWGEIMALAIALFVIVMGWTLDDERWMFVGVVIGLTTFAVVKIRGTR